MLPAPKEFNFVIHKTFIPHLYVTLFEYLIPDRLDW